MNELNSTSHYRVAQNTTPKTNNSLVEPEPTKESSPKEPDPRLQWPSWSCDLTPSKEPVNVGTKMSMVCQGDFVEGVDAKNLKLEFEPKEMEYALHILEVKNFEGQRLDLIVTGYRPGKFDNPKMYLSDGNKGLQLMEARWTVESILDPQKKPEPFPSLGPFLLPMPWWYWGGIGLLIFVIVLILFLRLKKVWDRRKLMDQLATHGTALTPFNQFNKDLRVIVRKWQLGQHFEKNMEGQLSSKELIEEMNRIVRQYFMRELLVPTFEWTDGQVLNEIKKRHRRVYLENREDIRRLLRELRRASSAEKELSKVDCEQLILMSRNITEKVYKVRRGKSQ